VNKIKSSNKRMGNRPTPSLGSGLGPRNARSLQTTGLYYINP